MEPMSSSWREKSRSGSSHGPASSSSTFTPRSASSLATTGPPAPAPTTMTSGWSTSDVLPVFGVALGRPVVAGVVPGLRSIPPAARSVLRGPFRVHPAVGEHQEPVDEVGHVRALLTGHGPEHLVPLVHV